MQKRYIVCWREGGLILSYLPSPSSRLPVMPRPPALAEKPELEAEIARKIDVEGWTLAQVCEWLKTQHGIALSQPGLSKILSRMPQREETILKRELIAESKAMLETLRFAIDGLKEEIGWLKGHDELRRSRPMIDAYRTLLLTAERLLSRLSDLAPHAKNTINVTWNVTAGTQEKAVPVIDLTNSSPEEAKSKIKKALEFEDQTGELYNPQ